VSLLDVAAGIAVFAAAGLQSAVGFGFSLVCAPLVFAAFGPQQAIGLLTVLGVEVNLVSVLGEGRRPRPLLRLIAVMLAAAVPGMLAGVVVLRNVDAVVLQVALTVVVFIALAVQWRPRAPAADARDAPVARSPAWTPAAGLAAGLLTTTTSAAGPPLVLLLLGRGLEPMRVRDTLTVSFASLGVLGGAALVATGTRGAFPHLVALAALVPLAALGQVAGRPLFARLATGRYELALTLVLSLSAVLGLVTAVV
jgi:uncharacterized membrane protein YfcA